MKYPKSWHTNKEIVAIRATPALATWAREQGLEAAHVGTTSGFFLVDPPSVHWSNAEDPFVPADVRQQLLLEWFPRVFESELHELGFPVEAWPDTNSIENFRVYFTIEHHALIADFGKESLKTTETPR